MPVIRNLITQDEGGGTRLFGLNWYIQCTAEQGKIFSVLSVFNSVYNFTIKQHEQGVFLNQRPSNECECCILIG